MIQIDLVTGFLGSGKTTFIKKYAQFLLKKGYKIGIIENDFGAVNVDMMLLQDLTSMQCDLEMISGGCDSQTHQRRFKTKLISMGMLGYDRIIVEPSGIYDIDEFFDVLHEEPLNQWYEIGNVFTLVHAKLEQNLSKEADYLLASQIACAGKIILSRYHEAKDLDIQNTLQHIQTALKTIHCQRQIQNDMICIQNDELTDADFESIISCGYVSESYLKQPFHFHDTYMTLYFMNVHMSQEQLYCAIEQMMNDEECGNIFRMKGFMQISENKWIEVNATKSDIDMKPITKGQEVMIVIGENLQETHIQKYWKVNEK